MTSIPDTPAGRQLAWYLDRLASAGNGATEADFARKAPDAGPLRWLPAGGSDQQDWWQLNSARIGAFRVGSIEHASDLEIAVVLDAKNGRRWRVTCRVEEEEAHRIRHLDVERVFDFRVDVREATAADGPVLADIERRCPIVLGDTSVTFDRGDDYFAFARLMDEVAIGLGLVDGVPAAINCGGAHNVRIGGTDKRIMTAIHTRVLPEHQGKGLWGAVSRVLNEKFPPGVIDGSRGFVSVNNVAMQKGFANTPNKWDSQVLRVLLPCASLASPDVGRPATPRDAEHIIAIINSCHAAEEMYLPYTLDSFSTRLERAPQQYSWNRIWMTERAALGVWPAGDDIRMIIESNGQRTESRRGLVLDYGFVDGAENDFEDLLRASCARLYRQGFDMLSIFTSERSPGYPLLRRLGGRIEAFDVWTPGIPVPSSAAGQGLYVDQIYF